MTRLVEMRSVDTKWEDEDAILIALRDVTEKQKIEEERLKASKLESISILAGGIAHDFNNYLTAILGNISLAKFKLDPESEAYNILMNAESASHLATGLTHQLLALPKGGAHCLPDWYP